MSRFAQNVGRLDAILRLIVGAGILVGMVLALRGSDSDWALTLLIHPSLLAAYLILTAVARNDVAYHFLGWSTRRDEESAPRRHKMRLAPPRSG